jgi:threonine/homoserine/homoserine lactone efflux protein
MEPHEVLAARHAHDGFVSMNDIMVVAKGMLAGLAISAPVGPVNMLCVSRTITKGRAAGIVSGLGAGAADTIYGAIAGLSISFVIAFLVREEFWIRLAGGILLVGIGLWYYFRKPRSLTEERKLDSEHSAFVTAFLLNLTNPTVVLSFLAILTALGLQRHKAWAQDLALVLGMFFGAMLWWTALVAISGHFRDRFSSRGMLWMNRVAGIAIGGFGVATLILAAARRH